ncbi:hypothetical protein CAXC1_120048 [Candidatus Xenohaliotis californiensis]|uniref:Uncharacterized protein n=1 Tax=Candidatus Xenohaliotis californiensis TaxID=84677 RepID=A0ABM9N744_9RICK|nr:hypothetical protein CAXC1_120048 [Candidatus Xenohaliotis californiensis]
MVSSSTIGVIAGILKHVTTNIDAVLKKKLNYSCLKKYYVLFCRIFFIFNIFTLCINKGSIIVDGTGNIISTGKVKIVNTDSCIAITICNSKL